MPNQKPTLIDWFGLRRDPDFSKARWLGGMISIIVSLLFAAICIGVIIAFFASLWANDANREGLRNTGLVLAAIIGVPFLVWRSIVAQMQVNVAEQGLITDRINKAVQGLGAEKTVKRHKIGESGELAYIVFNGKPDYSQPLMEEITAPNLEVRIGSIYALERIARDSARDQEQVMEILCAYIRENAPLSISVPLPEKLKKVIEIRQVALWPWHSDQDIWNWAHRTPGPREDVQVALTVIGRNQFSRDTFGQPAGRNKPRINLNKTCLQGADLSGLDLRNSNLKRCRLQGANLSGANLSGSNLHRARLQGAILQHANLRRAQLRRVQLHSANLEFADLSESNLHRAQLQFARIDGTKFRRSFLARIQLAGCKNSKTAKFKGAAARHCDFSEVEFGDGELSVMFGDQTVQLPNLEKRPDHWKNLPSENWMEFYKKWRIWLSESSRT